jgi:hypothetical protein
LLWLDHGKGEADASQLMQNSLTSRITGRAAMSNSVFQIAVTAVTPAQLAVLLCALLVPRGTRAVLVANLVIAGGVLIYWLPSLPSELSGIASRASSDILDYGPLLVCLFELGVSVVSGLALAGIRVPAAAAWLGFAVNFTASLLFLVFAFTFEFRCCGYL